MKIPKKDEYIKFKTFGRKMKSLFLVYANFESILPSHLKIKESKTQMILILRNIKNMLLLVMDIN